MPTPLRVAIFLAVVLALNGLAHAYIYHRLVRRPQWPSPLARRMLGSALVGLAVFLPLAMIASRFLPRPAAQPVAYLAFTWMGMIFYLLLLFGLFDAGRLLARLLRRAPAPPDPARRALLHRGAAVAVGGASVAVSSVALREGLGESEIREVGVKLDRLPPKLSGLTIVQLSDMHIGPTLGRGFTRGIVERVNALKPDLVVVTGDLVDGSVDQLMEHVAPLAGLRARYGRYFVTGNHEYYSGANAWSAALDRLGLRVLHDEKVEIGDDGGRIELLGIDDWSVYGGQADARGARLAARLTPDRERILLAHQPRAVGEAVRFDAGLQLSGHTHGGQLFPFSALVGLTTPYVAGLYDHTPRTQVYVSRGTGFWGPPMRFLAPAEITKIVLG